MAENKKVLIVTYYWPPSGGAGVQRWLKFTKYLPKYGWDPIVFTPENPQFDLKDESLVKDVNAAVDVLKFPIWEPYGLFKKLTGTKELKQGQILEDNSNSAIKSLIVFLRGNLFVPDPKRFWVKPSVEYLQGILKTNDIKHIITTGPPHSVHLIGLKLKYLNPSLTWMADFRDPWTEWDIMKQFKMLPFVEKKHRKLEKEVLKVADVVLATGDQAAVDLKALGAKRTKVYTNGYDADIKSRHIPAEKKEGLSLLHLGMLNENRMPGHLFQALDDSLAKERFNFQFRLTGIISPIVLDKINSLNYLQRHLSVQDSIDYQDLIQEYEKADVLLLLQTNSKESNSQLPGKLFEYLAQKKPILAFGDPESDVAKILNETNSGVMLSYADEKGIKKAVSDLINGTYGSAFEFIGIEKYSREEVTKRLAALLDDFDHS